MSLPPLLKNRLSLPVVGSPLFIISNPETVIAQCKAGIVGSFPALNARPEPVLGEWLERITSELAAHDAAHLDGADEQAATLAGLRAVFERGDRS